MAEYVTGWNRPLSQPPGPSSTWNAPEYKKARCEQRAFISNSEEELVLNDLDEVLDLEDHAADGRVVHLVNGAADLAKAQSLQGLALVGRTADRGANLGDVKSLLRFSQDYASFFSDQP